MITNELLAYRWIEDLSALIPEIPSEGILSKTIHKDAQMKAVLFAFDTGQSLSEHTASQPAIIQILQGEATVTLDGDVKEAKVGSWIYMPPRMKHSVVAKSPVIMLLLLGKTE
jgi:quercetin dioxygenase-like cupin family protein